VAVIVAKLNSVKTLFECVVFHVSSCKGLLAALNDWYRKNSFLDPGRDIVGMVGMHDPVELCTVELLSLHYLE